MFKIANNLGRTIKKFRKKAGLTQPDLAQLLNVSFSTLRRWEAYGGQPRTNELKKLSEVLGCTEAELLNGTASENWELKLLVSKENEGGTVDMTGSGSTATLNIGDNAMGITLSAPYELWEDDAKFEELLEDLRRKRATGLKTRREGW